MSAARAKTGCFSTLLFLLLLVAGSLIIWAIFLEPFTLLARSLLWVKTPCRIVASKVEPARESGGNVAGFYRPDIRYSYSLNGETFRSNHIWVIKHDTETFAEANSV